jgi:hypothetical protein
MRPRDESPWVDTQAVALGSQRPPCSLIVFLVLLSFCVVNIYHLQAQPKLASVC